MKQTLAVLAGLWLTTLLSVTWYSQWDMQFPLWFGLLLGLSGALLVLFRLAARTILRGAGGLQLPSLSDIPGQTGQWSSKSLILLAAALAIEIASHLLFSEPGPLFAARIAVLFGLGYLLSRWCNSRPYAPVLSCLILLIPWAAWLTLQYLLGDYRGGEASFIYAGGIVWRIIILPFEATVAWGGWLIGETLKQTFGRTS
ncbi:MAG TPA: hypothetical protein DEB40_12320 [Elusimicrobia bacterium]|nr:hypothetical protein [Elusimicrobiota bacterium]